MTEFVNKDRDYCAALFALKKEHKRVARAGWNGKGMWLEYVSRAKFYRSTDFQSTETTPFIVMKTADDKWVPWLCSQTDMLAEDWEIFS